MIKVPFVLPFCRKIIGRMDGAGGRNTTMSVEENLKAVLEQIEKCRKASGAAQEVRLLAVSKTKPYDDIMEAYRAGQLLFGESYAQEAAEKIDRARDSGIRDIVWYFIGPLQSNKTRPVAERFDWVLSCDREKIARRLNDQRPAGMRPLNVCIQINISGEEQKSGIGEDGIMALAKIVNDLPALTLRGLMGIALNTDDEAVLKEEFTNLNRIYLNLKKLYPTVDTLSMGMTADMEPAIGCGSNLVRIGTRIFGARNYN